MINADKPIFLGVLTFKAQQCIVQPSGRFYTSWYEDYEVKKIIKKSQEAMHLPLAGVDIRSSVSSDLAIR